MKKRLFPLPVFLVFMAALSAINPIFYARRVPAVRVHLPFGKTVNGQYRAVVIEKEWLVLDTDTLWIAERVQGLFGETAYRARRHTVSIEEEEDSCLAVGALAYNTLIILPESRGALTEGGFVTVINLDAEYETM